MPEIIGVVVLDAQIFLVTIFAVAHIEVVEIAHVGNADFPFSGKRYRKKFEYYSVVWRIKVFPHITMVESRCPADSGRNVCIIAIVRGES